MNDKINTLSFSKARYVFDSIFDYELRKGLLQSFKIMAIGIGGIVLSKVFGDVTIGEQTMPSFVWMYLAIAFQAGVIVRHLGVFK